MQARYCDEACQKADWKQHGKYCIATQKKIKEKKKRKKEAKEAEMAEKESG